MTTGEALALAMIGGAAVVALFRNGVSRQIALAMIAGIIAMRLFVWGLPYEWRFLGSSVVWFFLGGVAIRRGLIAPGALLITSGLCYAGQEVMRLPPAFGNPWLVSADLFWWLALMGVYRGRLAGLSEGVGLGYSPSRRGLLAVRRDLSFAKEAGK